MLPRREPHDGDRARRRRGHPDEVGDPQGAAPARPAGTLLEHAVRAAAGAGARAPGRGRRPRPRPGGRPPGRGRRPDAVRTAVQDEQHGTGHAVGLRAATTCPPGRPGRSSSPTATSRCWHRDPGRAARRAPRAPGNAVTVLTARGAPTRPATAGSCATRDGAVARIVEHEGRRPRAARDHARSTPASTPSTRLLRDALGPARPRQRPGRGVPHRRRSASLRADGTRVGRAPRRRRVEIEGSTTGSSWPPAPRAQPTAWSSDWMRAGVTVVDPATTWIDADVTLEPDAVLAARHMQLHGGTRSAPAPRSGRTPR